MRVSISPSKARGSVEAPPSKSMAHRLLICAGLASKLEPSIIHGIENSQDILATIDCLNVLGAGITQQESATVVYGIDSTAVQANDVLPCRECGSTLRFFVPLCLLFDKPLSLTGSPTLLSRPMGVYQDICREQGLHFSQNEQGIQVQGPLRAGAFEVPGNISSQFISGLLFALPLLQGTSTITLVPPVESRPYIDMTIQALSSFGVQVNWENDTTLTVPGGQRYHNTTLRVEGDYSNAAFFEALNYVGENGKNKVQVTDLLEDSLQGDSIYRELFPLLAGTSSADTSASLAPASTAATPVGTYPTPSPTSASAYPTSSPASFPVSFPTISLANCPDLGPVLMAVAAANNGAVFTHCARLALKESNRGHAMAQELAKFGIRVDISPDEDTITVHPGTLCAPRETLCGHNDHRIVMALAVLACAVGGTIKGAQAVSKSFPCFFEYLSRLGVELFIEKE